MGCLINDRKGSQPKVGRTGLERRWGGEGLATASYKDLCRARVTA